MDILLQHITKTNIFYLQKQDYELVRNFSGSSTLMLKNVCRANSAYDLAMFIDRVADKISHLLNID
jgi:stress response protein SCP2